MKAKKQPEGLKPGIYFGLPENTYHADPALSHGGMVKLLVSWRDYWEYGPLNPNRAQKKPTDAMVFGTRCHELLMDPASFFEKYSVTGSSKWMQGKQLIARDEFDRIKDSIDEIKRVKGAYAYFQDGMPEVTIVWVCRVTGVRLRIRIDWLRVFGGIDYKRVKNIENNALGWVIADHGYDIQQELYQQGIAEIRALLRAGKVATHGVYDKAWLKRFMDDEDCLFRFFFQRSIQPFVFTIKSFDAEILANARQHIEDAKNRYVAGIKAFGTSRPPAGNAETEEFSIYHLPRRIIDRGAQEGI